MGRARLLTSSILIVWLTSLVVICLGTQRAHALVITQSGSVDVTALVLPTTPTEAAIIDQPQDNIHRTTTPLVVIGRCGAGLLVRIFDNALLAGSVTCAPDSTFVANIMLISGKNVLTSLNYDAFDQAGPTSPSVTVYVDTPTPTTPGGKPAAPISQEQELLNELFGTSAPGQPSLPAGSISEAGQSDSQHMFEGTFVEPVAKLLDVPTPVVAPVVNQAVNVATSGIFILAIVAIGFLLLF